MNSARHAPSHIMLHAMGRSSILSYLIDDGMAERRHKRSPYLRTKDLVNLSCPIWSDPIVARNVRCRQWTCVVLMVWSPLWDPKGANADARNDLHDCMSTASVRAA